MAAAAVHGTTLKDAREHDHAATERRLLVEALERFRGNKRAVARHLEIAPKTLYRLLKKHGIFAAGEGREGRRALRAPGAGGRQTPATMWLLVSAGDATQAAS